MLCCLTGKKSHVRCTEVQGPWFGTKLRFPTAVYYYGQKVVHMRKLKAIFS